MATVAGTPPYTQAQIDAMWHNGVRGDAKRAQDALNAWLAAHPTYGQTPTPTPTPTPAPVEGPTWAARLASSRALAENRAALYLQSQGLNPAQYMPLIHQQFDTISSNLLETDDPSKAFDDTIASSVVQGEQQRQRQGFMNSVNTQFTPGYEREQLPSTLLDDTIAEILGQQRGTAEQYLERGRARGIFNDAGYAAGQTAIGNDYGVGNSELTGLEGSILDNYYTQLDDISGNAYNAASGWQLGDTAFSLDPYMSQYNTVLGDARTNAPGQLRSLLGGRNFFDLSGISNAAGASQGALNLRDTDVATALAERQRRNSVSRGLGSQGAF